MSEETAESQVRTKNEIMNHNVRNTFIGLRFRDTQACGAAAFISNRRRDLIRQGDSRTVGTPL